MQPTLRLRRLLGHPAVRGLALALALVVAVVSWRRAPQATLAPVLIGLLPFTLGKYVLCPLRWHTLSASGQSRRWHLRVYAESEVLGLLSPGHAGADLWRIHSLHRLGMGHPGAVADVGLDRLVGAVGLVLFAMAGGAALPPQLLGAVVGIALVALLVAYALRRRMPRLLADRPAPRRGQLARGLLLSLGYQATIIGLLLSTVWAVGHRIDPLALVAIFGASQVAGVIPGVHGAGPREGALVAGLVALGMPFSSALGAISLTSLVAWLPALALGGTCLLLRRRHAARHPSSSAWNAPACSAPALG